MDVDFENQHSNIVFISARTQIIGVNEEYAVMRKVNDANIYKVVV